MNLSRRSILQGIFAAPAVISIDSLMPVRLWVPTIYGDAIHDDYEGLSAWMKGEKVNILPRGFSHNDDVFNIGEGIFRVSNTLEFPARHWVIGQESGTTIKADPGVPCVITVEYDGVSPSERLENIRAQSVDGYGIRVLQKSIL